MLDSAPAMGSSRHGRRTGARVSPEGGVMISRFLLIAVATLVGLVVLVPALFDRDLVSERGQT